VHLLEWPDFSSLRHPGPRAGVPLSSGAAEEDSGTPDQVRGDEYIRTWGQIRDLRERVTESIEPLRGGKVVRSGLEASGTVPAEAVPEGFTDEDLAELFISGPVSRGDALAVSRTADAKCGRCWRLLPEVPEDGGLCIRCADVVERL